MSAFDENPFADPSVQRAVEGTGTTKANLDDYNPFDAQKNATTSANNGGSGTGPAVMNPSSTNEEREPPPAYTKSGQQQISTADFQRRQEELERRARDLERREEELKNTPYNARQNNWPPLPTWCPWGLKPCFYQDINVDIPVEFQKIVRNLYYLWVAHAGLLTANLVVGLLYLFSSKEGGAMFGLALVYWVIYTPLSFICWFRPAYKAFRDDSSFNFMVFFFVFFFQFMISVIYALGIGGMGSSGFITGIYTVTAADSNGYSVFVGVLMLITGLGFAVCALGDFYLLVTIHKLYRSSGASMAKAQAEFTSGVMQNEQVQAAAASAARETVRSQFNQAASGGGGANTTAPRY